MTNAKKPGKKEKKSFFYELLHDYALLFIGTKDTEEDEELPKSTVYMIFIFTVFLAIVFTLLPH